jgi:hypothetical protein
MFNSKTSKFFILSIAGVLSLLIGSSAIAQSNATNKASNQLASQDPAKDQIYGWQVMTDAEREAYKKQMGAFKNATERDVFLQDHRARMNSRAREKGITLRDTAASSTQSTSTPSPTTMSAPNDASKSRLVGGLHYRSDCEVGLRVGNDIGQYAIDRAKTDGAN